MSGLLIKCIPAELHQRLRKQAKRHRRSMTQEAIVILERTLGESDEDPFVEPARAGAGKATQKAHGG